MDTIDQESIDLLANIKNTGDGKPVILKFVLAYKGTKPRKMTIYKVSKKQKDKEAVDKKARLDLIKECRTNGVKGISCVSGRLTGDAKNIVLQLDNQIYGENKPVTEQLMKSFLSDAGVITVTYEFINYLFFELCDEWDSYWGQVIPPLYYEVMRKLAPDINSPDPENPNKAFAEKLRNAWEVLTLEQSYEPSQTEPKGQSEESLTLLKTAISFAERLLPKIKDKLSTFDNVNISNVGIDRGEESSVSRADLEDLYAKYERQINEAGLAEGRGLGLQVYKQWSKLLDKKDDGGSQNILADFAQLDDLLAQVDDFREAQELSRYLRELFEENLENLSGNGRQLLSNYRTIIAEAKAADRNGSSDYTGTLTALVEIKKRLSLIIRHR